MARSGVKISQILTHLKLNSHNILSTTREIANETVAARKELLDGIPPIQALYDMFQRPKRGYTFDIKLGPGGNVKSLFFSKENVIAMCHCFRYVFLMDCTYKTNCFGMPLMNIVGIASTFKTFNAGFAFLSAEKESDYRWAHTIFQKNC
jgi:MULE transposase domain